MNAFKKYLRKNGVKLNSDYPSLPYYLKGKSCFEPGYILIEDVSVNSEEATYTEVFNVDTITTKVNRDGTLAIVESEDEWFV